MSAPGDGLRHFAYQKEGKFYNGVTMDDIHSPSRSTVNGIGAWAAQGIVGRGVLLDYHAWREEHHPEAAADRHAAFRTGSISAADLREVAQWQGTELKFGDILFIRSGWMQAHAKMEKQELEGLREVMPHGFIGAEQSEDMLQWVWEHFSAVAGDQPSFECWRKWIRLRFRWSRYSQPSQLLRRSGVVMRYF